MHHMGMVDGVFHSREREIQQDQITVNLNHMERERERSFDRMSPHQFVAAPSNSDAELS